MNNKFNELIRAAAQPSTNAKSVSAPGRPLGSERLLKPTSYGWTPRAAMTQTPAPPGSLSKLWGELISECAIIEQIEKMRANTYQGSNPFARSNLFKGLLTHPRFSTVFTQSVPFLSQAKPSDHTGPIRGKPSGFHLGLRRDFVVCLET